MTNTNREPLYLAAINCPHEIDHNRVVLHYDDKQPGHNALAQLGDRLAKAAQQVPPGFALVPIEPTAEMIDAACPPGETVDHYDMAKALRAAIAAAPNPLAPPPESPAVAALTDEHIEDAKRLSQKLRFIRDDQGCYFDDCEEAADLLAKIAAHTAAQPQSVTDAARDVLTAEDADMVWPDYDTETFHHSIDDAVDYEVDQAWPTEGPLELKVQLAKRIPTATIRIFNITENGHEWEIVRPVTEIERTRAGGNSDAS